MGASIDLVLASAEGSATFLGEDVVGWRTALIAAAVAAIAYESTLALLRRLRPAARWVTSQIPYLVLLISWVTVSNKAWRAMHDEMRGALWDVLRDEERSPLTSWFYGLWFSLSLVFGGAARTAWELKHPVAFTRLIPVAAIPNPVSHGVALAVMLVGGGSTVAFVQVIVHGPWWATLLVAPCWVLVNLPFTGLLWQIVTGKQIRR